jgi:thioredoxin:protein disulfide reductase
MAIQPPPHLSPPLRQRRALLGALLIVPTVVRAGILDDAPSGAGASDRFLPVDEAFRVQWVWSAAGVAVGEFVVAPGYYLYRDRIRVQLKSPAGGQLAALELPAGEVKEDPYAGRQVVYHHSFSARQAITLPAGPGSAVELEVVWQGCADAGLCYPPVRRTFSLRG